MAYLTVDRQKEIDKRVEEFKGSGYSYYPIISLDEMAKRNGITVREADLKKLNLEDVIGWDISEKLSGFITYDDPATRMRPQIYIDSGMSSERKRFTLAHELGHHCLHEGVKLRLDTIDYFSESKESTEETEANYFAASLLMPKKLLLAKLKESLTDEDIASYFQVSLPAAKNRIRWIKSN